jgi:hypothetical protein
MPISTSSFGDERDSRYNEYEKTDLYDQETLDFPGLSPAMAESFLKKLGGGVAEKECRVEGVGWNATIHPREDGVAVEFDAHEELLDDLIRRFELMAEKASG